MGTFDDRKMRTLLVLSIITGGCLLTGVSLSGVMRRSPVILQEIQVASVQWCCDRPAIDDVFYGNNSVKNAYVSDVATLEIEATAENYYWQDTYFFCDYAELLISMNADASPQTLESFKISFQTPGNTSRVMIHPENMWLYITNITLDYTEYIGKIRNNPYVTGKPTASSCQWMFMVNWFLYGPTNLTQVLDMDAIFYCKNGTGLTQITLPLSLRMEPDVGNDFDSAKEVSRYKGLGCLGWYDLEDFYSVQLEKGQTLDATIVPPNDTDYDLYLYSPSRELIGSSASRGDMAEHLTLEATDSGRYYVLVERFLWPEHHASGIYEVSLQTS